MQRYETIFIIDPDLGPEEREPLFEKLRALMDQMNGFLVGLEQWGVKKLAYEIKKKIRGYYIRLDYCGSGGLVNEMERVFQIDDRVLKYMTVLLDKTPDVEHIKEEIANAASAHVDASEEDVPAAGDTDQSAPASEPAETEPVQAEPKEEE